MVNATVGYSGSVDDGYKSLMVENAGTFFPIVYLPVMLYAAGICLMAR